MERENRKWSVRVSSAGPGLATAFVRKQKFAVGAPVTFDDDDPSVSALEYVLGALGADLVNGFVALARLRRVLVDHAEAVVHGRLDNPMMHVGVVGETGHPGLDEVTVKVYVSSSAPEEAVRKVWQETLDKSPLVHTLRPAVRLGLELAVTP
jgi:hypothetical protein